MGVLPDDLSTVAAELRAAVAEHDRVCAALPAAEEAHKRAWLTAHANSTSLFRDRRVKEHETAAEQGSFEEWARLNALQNEAKAARARMRSLQSILSAYQTQVRTEREMVG